MVHALNIICVIVQTHQDTMVQVVHIIIVLDIFIQIHVHVLEMVHALVQIRYFYKIKKH